MRPRLIELNGQPERVELLLLTFIAPIWGVVFPLLALTMPLSFPSILLIGFSCFCLVHFLALDNNEFSFEENGLRLPGVDHRLRPYSSLKAMYIENARPLSLNVELEGDDGKKSTHRFEAQSLTEESARQFWQLCAAKLRTCAISLDVRDRLVNWRLYGVDGLLNNPEPPAAEDSLHLGRDLSLQIELKPFNVIKLIERYMVSYSDTFRNTWLTFWTVAGVIAYPTVLCKAFTPTLVSPTVARAFSEEGYQNMLNGGLYDLNHMSWESLGNFFGNYWGAAGLIILLAVLMWKFVSHLNDPDSVYIDYLGITTQKRTPAGIQPAQHRSWKALHAVHLIRPGKKSNSSRWSVVFEAEANKSDIVIPFKALSSDRVREKFVECLDGWGKNIEIDPALLEALTPVSQTSYTELWMSALAEAPKIDDLTPHSVGLKLTTYDYEIVQQLGSGGQGVTYLARRPARENSDEYEQVVLKETVLPIYVDERARARAVERFKRDANLLASLEHKNIVHLENHFVENNRAYLALEYVSGMTLKDKVEKEGPLDEAEVRRLALIMCDILTYLHERTPPVVHRDFTPDNLILTDEGIIKLIDFDVAVEQSTQTNATIVGKQAYIPLEQFRGKACPQSDIYALGATLYFLLTGEEPAAIQASHPQETRAAVSDDLDTLIAHATAPDPANRLPDAAMLRRQLQAQADKVNMGVS